MASPRGRRLARGARRRAQHGRDRYSSGDGYDFDWLDFYGGRRYEDSRLRRKYRRSSVDRATAGAIAGNSIDVCGGRQAIFNCERDIGTGRARASCGHGFTAGIYCVCVAGWGAVAECTHRESKKLQSQKQERSFASLSMTVFKRRRGRNNLDYARAVGSSFSILPSRTRMTRWAWAAMSGSWVTRMMVLPRA